MTRFAFPGAYGGVVESDTPPQIHAKIKELRRAVTLEAKKAPGVMFPVKSAKELNQKLAEALDSLDMVAAPINQEIVTFATDNIPKNENSKGNPVFRTLIHCKTTVRIIAPDTSYIDVVGSGHGGDVDDKAGGKASTFSWKDAVLKGLTVPHEDMVDTDDDSSIEPAKSYTASKAQPGTTDKFKQESDQESNLSYVLDQIAKAESEADLEVIRTAIKTGVRLLHGQDKLKAADAFAKKMAKFNG